MSDSISKYFAQYPEFNFVPDPSDWRQTGPFNALAMQKGWDQLQRDLEFIELKMSWTGVAEDEFEQTKLEHYQALCRDLNIRVRESIVGCKEELRRVNVNIVDLVQYRRDRRAGIYNPGVTWFDTVQELKEYSIREAKFYPVDTAKSDMLRGLLKDFSQV
jgi:hypothetical protein